MSRIQSAKRQLKRILIGVVGGVVLLFGLLTIPYPGPGWLTVLAGLAILATEFEWAQRLLHQVKERYERWQYWLKRQPLHVKAVFWILTCLVVVTTIYLLNGYGLINDFFNAFFRAGAAPIKKL